MWGLQVVASSGTHLVEPYGQMDPSPQSVGARKEVTKEEKAKYLTNRAWEIAVRYLRPAAILLCPHAAGDASCWCLGRRVGRGGCGSASAVQVSSPPLTPTT